MSPVFRHGGLRLYLLKLLDEAPRHGYDVIRLLQDRFLGVYSPSPGTIYPRLARLEEEGLVTHEVVDGKKVYKITDAGREELNRRLDDLADLEDELSASVRDIAREISRDVRETVRNLRDELTWAVREAGREGGPGRRSDAARGASAAGSRTAETSAAEPGTTPPGAAEPGTTKTSAAGAGTTQTSAAGAGTTAAGATESATTEAGAGEARADHARDSATGDAGQAAGHAQGRTDGDEDAAGDERRHRRPPGDWREWADWADRREWREWVRWAKEQDWSEWAGRQDWSKGRPRDRASSEPDLAADLERLASAFAREVRAAARQAEMMSEDAVSTLSQILTDAMSRIKAEVFRSSDTD